MEGKTGPSWSHVCRLSKCSCRVILDIKAMKKAVVRYEQIAGAKVNFDKSEGLRLGYYIDSISLPVPFCWSYVPIRILEGWFEPGLQQQ